MVGNRLVKIKNLLPLTLLVAAMTLPMAAPASAANTAITGGTNGPDCNSGGYFTPSSLTVQSGDTVTISVPSNDPYSGGMEIHGFPQGSFVVTRGASVTTSPLTSSVSYYGTWPSSGCMKGSGSVTVNAPAPSAPPAAGGPTGGISSQAPGSNTPTSSPAASKNAAPSGASTPANAAANQPDTTSPVADIPAKTAQPKTSSANKSISKTDTRSPGTKNVAAIGGGIAVLVAASVFVVWHFGLHRRLVRPAEQNMPVAQPGDNPQPNNDTINHNQV